MRCSVLRRVGSGRGEGVAAAAVSGSGVNRMATPVSCPTPALPAPSIAPESLPSWEQPPPGRRARPSTCEPRFHERESLQFRLGARQERQGLFSGRQHRGCSRKTTRWLARAGGPPGCPVGLTLTRLKSNEASGDACRNAWQSGADRAGPAGRTRSACAADSMLLLLASVPARLPLANSCCPPRHVAHSQVLQCFRSGT